MKCKTLTLLILVASLERCLPTEGLAPAQDEVIPLIEMRDVPVTGAIRDLARRARLNIIMDPRLSQPPFVELKVSLRWEGVTAREALKALLENYGLVLVER